MFKEERSESQFEWSMLGDTEAGRHVKEVDCWGSGGRVCRFTVDPK